MPINRILTPEQEEICSKETVDLVKCLKKDVSDNTNVMHSLQEFIPESLETYNCKLCPGYDHTCAGYESTVSSAELIECYWRNVQKKTSIDDCKGCVKTGEEMIECKDYFPNIFMHLLE